MLDAFQNMADSFFLFTKVQTQGNPLVPKRLVRGFCGSLNHGRHRNASLCGTERAEKDGFHAFQPQIAPFKISVYGRWAYASELPEGLFRAAFSAPRTRASVCSVVKLVLNHGRHRNASLCGTERAEKDGFHAFQPQIAPFKISVYGRWALVSERVRSAA